MKKAEKLALEGAHKPDSDPFWQESWYFNFSDPESAVYGLARIAVNPARGRADGLALASVAGRRALLYPALGKRLDHCQVTLNPPECLRTGSLVFSCDRPMENWRIALYGREASLELAFASMTPVHDYPAPAAGEKQSAAARHYEQAGRVTGSVTVRGRTLPVNGLGQRDHSWGPRHWAGVSRWIWISGQFPSGRAFNFWRVGKKDGPAAGFFADEKGIVEVEDGAAAPRGFARDMLSRPARVALKLADGREKQIVFRPRTRWPLYKGGSMIFETFGSMTLDGEEGVGVYETLKRSPLGPLPLTPFVPRYTRLALASL